MVTPSAPPPPPLPRRRSAWRRFASQRSGLAGLWLLAGAAATALLFLPVAARWYNVQSLGPAVRHAPSFSPIVGFDAFAARDSTLPDSSLYESYARGAHRMTSILGHDDLGRSVFFRLCPAWLISMAVGLGAVAAAVVIGTTWGAVSALIGGRVDQIMMRIVDVLYGLPYVLMVILLQTGLEKPLRSVFGASSHWTNLVILMLAIGGVSWLTMARVVRGQVLSLRTQPFVDAARVAGAGWFFIFRRHIVPSVMGPVVVNATLVIPQAVLQESFLSFLGIGISPPTPSLGQMAAEGVESVNTFVGFWWLLVYPCAALVVTLVALNFVGESLRRAVDPKSSAAGLA